MTIKEVWLNREIIELEKKNAIKHADIITYQGVQSSNKAAANINTDATKLDVELVINTTNLIDSHMDCHIDGIWTKSLKEIGLFYLLQEHEMEFKYIIADSKNDNLKAYTRSINWKQLGYPYKGDTQALLFSATLDKSRNEFMFNQYLKGYVLNHSVGMRYVKMFLCINSDEPMYSSEKQNWDKYYPVVANKEVADEKGYFWAVTEAKVIEGSAVVKGSNHATPTISVTESKDFEPSADTQNKGDEAAETQSHEDSTSKPQIKSLSINKFL